jgi:hypothetical protein
VSKLHSLIEEHESSYLDKLKQTQSEITKSIMATQGSMSKSQQKRHDKFAQQAWGQTNVPKDSLSLHNAVMYL